MASIAPDPGYFAPDEPAKLRRILQSCTVHDHLCLIYDTREEQLAAVIPFMRVGLERGEKCLYIASENSVDDIASAMRDDGIDVDAAIASGALFIFNEHDSYLKNGDFDPASMLEFLKESTIATQMDGFTALRVTGEMSWVLDGRRETLDQLIDYECQLNDFFPPYKVLAICQYNRRRFSPEALLQVIHAHPLLVSGNLVCDNSHYIPPEAFHQAKHDPASEIQRLLDNIVETAELKQELAFEADQARRLAAESGRWRRLYEALLANTPDLGYIFDLNHRFTFANHALLKMWGRNWDEAIGKTCLDLGYEPWHAAMHDREIEQVIATRRPVRGEVPFNGANGRRIYDYIFFPVLGADGNVEAVAGTTRDITERRAAEATVRANEQRYRELLEALPVAVYTTDADGRITLYNQAAARFAGRYAEIGKDRWCVTHRLYRPDGSFLPHDECPMGVSLRTGIEQRGVEAIAERPDGSRVWFIPYPTVLRDASGNITGAVNVLVDITERKRAEILLVEQKQILELIAGGCPLSECLTALTAALSRMLPKARAAVLTADRTRKKMDRVFSSELAAGFGANIQGAPISDLLIGTCGTAIFEGRPVACSDIANDTRWSKPWRDLCIAHGVLSGFSTPVLDSEQRAVASFFLTFSEPHEPDEWERTLGEFGAHVAGIAISRDRAEQALRENEDRLAADLTDTLKLQSISAEISQEENPEILYEKVMDAAIAIMHSDFGSMQMFHPEHGKAGELRLIAHRGFDHNAVRLWEWVQINTDSSCGAALRANRRMVIPDMNECSWMAGTEGLKAYQAAGIRAAQSTPLISRSGKILGMISTHWSTPHQPSERDFRMLDIVARQAADLIERRQAEERQKQSEAALRKSEKFAAAGRMAATIAHEINNPLEAIVNLWYLLDQETLSPTGREMLKALGEELDRVSHITKQTLEFYRDGNSATLLKIAEPIDAAITLFSRKAEAAGIKIETEYRTSATLFGFAGELRQLFANLIGNALEAGATSVKVRVSPGRKWDGSARRGIYIVFADNGAGIPAEIAGKLFEPFFTTKAEKGTGLGLWVSRGIVQKHEGWMRMRTSTQNGRSGTAFCIFLPLLSQTGSDLVH